MITPELILLWIELAVGFLASVLALFVWARGREISWLFVTASFIVRFFGKIYRSLTDLGFIDRQVMTFYSIPFDTVLFVLLPDVLILFAFIMFLITISRL